MGQIPDPDDFTNALSVATPDELNQLAALSRPLHIPYLPNDRELSDKQLAFLALICREAFYGGAAGGGKSEALLAGALQYVDEPGYSALILRRSYADLALSDSLMERSKNWLSGMGPVWRSNEKTWTFPSGATLTFGYLKNEADKYRYKSSAFQYIAFDELTQFTESQYRYLFTRLRNKGGYHLPCRMRSASNPGDVGHEWVKRRFVNPAHFQAPGKRVFIPARLEDNPGLDYDEYVESLRETDPITLKQMLAGDWDAFEGGRFQRQWFRRYSSTPKNYTLKLPTGSLRIELPRPVIDVWKDSCTVFVLADPAATAKESSDNTAIGAFAVTPGRQLLVLEMLAAKLSHDEILPALLDMALRHGAAYVGIEAVAFQWGFIHAARRMEGMPPVKPLKPGGKGKLPRAVPAIVKASEGEIYVPETGAWVEEFITELVMFTGDEKLDAADDQVDLVSYAVQHMSIGMAAVQEGVAETENDDETDRRRRPANGAAARRGLYGQGNRR